MKTWPSAALTGGTKKLRAPGSMRHFRPGGHRADPAARCGEAISLCGRVNLPGGAVAGLADEPGASRRADDFGGDCRVRGETSFFREAVRLRYWDDAAKVMGLQVPAAGHYRERMEAELGKG